MANFNAAVERLLKNEGGYIDNPLDSGGETNFGISKRSYPREDIKNLTRERAIFIYRRDFWGPICGDHLDSQVLANHLLDFAANSGVRTAVRAFQNAIETVTDGICGPNTVKAANTCPDAIPRLIRARVMYCAAVVHDHPGQSQFLPNWMKRTMDYLV